MPTSFQQLKIVYQWLKSIDTRIEVSRSDLGKMVGYRFSGPNNVLQETGPVQTEYIANMNIELLQVKWLFWYYIHME